MLPDGLGRIGRIANFGICLAVFEFLRFRWFLPFFKKIWFLGILGPSRNDASRWIRDLWSKGVMLILAYFLTFLSFCVLDDFFRFSKKICFLGIFGPPSYGIGATIRIGREMLCLPYAGFFLLFKASALWTDAFYKSKCLSVCPCVGPSVCVFTFEVPFKRLFAPTSRSQMSNIFRDSESLGKSNGKKWSQMWIFCLKIVKNRRAKKKEVSIKKTKPYVDWLFNYHL